MSKLLLFFVCLVGVVQTAFSQGDGIQDLCTNETTVYATESGDWSSIVWKNLSTDAAVSAPPSDANSCVLIPSGVEVTYTGDLSFDSPYALKVEGNLTINGNVEFSTGGKNDYLGLFIGSGAQLIIFGDLISKNKVDLDFSSYLVVTGTVGMQGSQGEIDLSSDARVYFLGDIVAVDYVSLQCTEPENYVPGEDPSCGHGEFESFIDNEVDNPIFDIIADALIYNDGILTSPTTELCSGGTIDLTISDGGATNIRWYKDDVKIETNGSNPYTVSAIGTYYAIYKSGATWHQTNDVTITNDVTPPTIDCSAITNPTQIDADGGCGATIPDFRGSVVVSDNCTSQASISITQSPAQSSYVTGAGIHTVTITATDESGTQSTCTVDVELVDVTPPSFSCNSPVVVLPDANECYYTAGASGNLYPNNGSDNCGYTVTNDRTGTSSLEGEIFYEGDEVVWTAEDGYGNKSYCTVVVDINSSSPPELDCPASTILLSAESGLCTTTYDWEAALNIEACNGYNLGWTRDDGVVLDAEKFNFAVGTTVVNVTVTDIDNGLEATCEITVFVDENPDNPPSITAPDDVSVACDDAVPAQLTLSYFETNSLVSDNCGYENSSFAVNDVSVTNGDGSRTITRTYSISDYAGNPASDAQVITVTNDLEVNASITITSGCSPELLQITATTNGFGAPSYQWQRNEGTGWTDFDGDSTGDPLIFETSSYTEGDQFRIEVSEGGCTVYSSQLTLVFDDQEAPVFDASLDLNKNLCIPIGQSTTTTSGIGLTNVTQVSDNCSAFANLTITYSITGDTEVLSSSTGQNDASGVTFNVGNSTVVYTVTDESGNFDSYSFNVVVSNEPALPTIATDGNSGDDGSGYRPYQGSQHSYSTTNDAGFNYIWRVENSSSTDITSSLSVSGQGTASFSVTWGASSMPGNYAVYLTKQSQSTGCEVETSAAIIVLNSFNPKVEDFGDACHEVTGSTIMDFVVYLEPGTRFAPEWSFDWALYLDGGGTPVQTGNVTVTGQDDQTVSVTVNVGDGDEKNYRFEISNGQDSFGNTDIDTGDNEDLVKIFAKPSIGF